MKDWRSDVVFASDGALCVSIDLDVFDPAFAPGVSHPEPEGLTARVAAKLVKELAARFLAD